MTTMIMRWTVLVHAWMLDCGHDPGHGRASRDQRAERDRGQATTEYALVLLGAALIALLVVAWATGGGGAGKIGRLFDRVIDSVTSKIG